MVDVGNFHIPLGQVRGCFFLGGWDSHQFPLAKPTTPSKHHPKAVSGLENMQAIDGDVPKQQSFGLVMLI